MKVKHCVITSVDRDDLKDGGSTIWAETIRAVRTLCPGTTLETLIPDFKGIRENIQMIIDEKPEVVSHNLETVRRLTRQVRVQAKYEQSLEVLNLLKKAGLRTKSGLMLGLGETKEEVHEAMDDLRKSGVDILTLGNRLEEKNQLETIGGKSYLAALTNTVPTASNVAHYANIVHRKATRRRLLTSSGEISRLAYQEEMDDIENTNSC